MAEKLGSHLPEVIIEMILSKLPVKILLRFKCVSKSWLSLITSEALIKTHFQNSLQNTCFPHSRVIIEHQPLYQCSLQSLLNEPLSVAAIPLHDPLKMNRNKFLGCCNGIVCVMLSWRDFVFWNPSTRVSKKIPELGLGGEKESRILTAGFGWDESRDDYKVLVVIVHADPPKPAICKVYSSKARSWKIVESPHDLEKMGFTFNFETAGTFAEGKLLWVVGRDRKEGIICFDLKSESFAMMEPPPFHLENWTRPRLGVLGGCLCTMNVGDYEAKGIKIWVRARVRVRVGVMEESWERLSDLPDVLEFLKRPIGSAPLVVGPTDGEVVKQPMGESAPLVVGPDGQILLSYGFTFLVYNPREQVFKFLGKFNRYDRHLYVESLISPEFV